EFRSKITPIKDTILNGRYDLLVKTIGTLSTTDWDTTAGIDSCELSMLPKKLVAQALKHDRIKFTWTRQYRFNDSSFELISEKIHASAAKPNKKWKGPAWL